ncbi:MAG: serine/threonine-protein kinase [Planctomycetia bacterium]|nr:serine/threonine-protein kinase [Planctomycetia bacterium]
MSFEELADRFVEEYRKGLAPSVEQYAQENPEIAEEIRELFPTLVLLEREGRKESLSNFSSLGSAGAVPACPEKIDEYRIIREIGRGGMGIVYEARDENLDRLIALKILRIFPGEEKQSIERFHREAKMAARLHHTNIVPVFGSGEFDGKFYYIMQYIRGISIEQLLSKVIVKKFSDNHGKSAILCQDPAPKGAQNASFFSKDKDHPDFLGKHLPAEENVQKPVENAPSFDQKPDPLQKEESKPSQDDQDMDSSQRTRSTFSVLFPHTSIQEFLQDIHPDRSIDIHSFPDWTRIVCEMGIQIAEALHYAHLHHTLHRDIKPSNLLLDDQGTVWITDFGLAKPIDESKLTRQGQLIGTLRYMSPEGLDGTYLPQSDLYSLGLTLYEMITLTPAFGETNYSRLLGQVSQSRLIPPRKINKMIPGDLETIILKATAHAPEKRYQTGAELADDLRRFTEERPILARRVSRAEYIWRWCKKNRLTASLLATTLLFLVLLVITSSTGFFHVRNLLADKEAETRRAKTNLDLAILAFDDIFNAYHGPEDVFLFPREDSSLTTGFTSEPLTQKELGILESLLRFYNRLIGENGDDIDLITETAVAHVKIARIRQRVGNSQEALAAFKRGILLFRKAIDHTEEKDPLTLKMTQYANSFFADIEGEDLGNAYYREFISELIAINEAIPDPLEVQAAGSGQKVESEEDHDIRCLQLSKLHIYRALIEMNECIKRSLDTHNFDALKTDLSKPFEKASGQRDEMASIEMDLNRSKDYLDILMRKKIQDPLILFERVRYSIIRATFLMVNGEKERSIKAQSRAVDIMRELCREYPGQSLYKAGLLKILLNSSFLLRADMPRSAQLRNEHLKECGDLAKELIRACPENPSYSILSIMTVYIQAMNDHSAKDFAKAANLYQEAIRQIERYRERFPYLAPIRFEPDLHYNFAALLIAMKQKEAAKEELKKIGVLLGHREDLKQRDLRILKKKEALEKTL